MNLYFVGTLPDHEFRDMVKTISLDFLKLIQKDVRNFERRVIADTWASHYYDPPYINEIATLVEEEIMTRLLESMLSDGVSRT